MPLVAVKVRVSSMIAEPSFWIVATIEIESMVFADAGVARSTADAATSSSARVTSASLRSTGRFRTGRFSTGRFRAEWAWDMGRMTITSPAHQEGMSDLAAVAWK